MQTRGKYGITRDVDGSLSNLMHWPWYWRNPIAAVGACAGIFSLAMGSTQTHASLAMQILGGSVVLLSAVLGYELTGLCIAAGALYWLYSGTPNQGQPWWYPIAICAAFCAFFHFRDAIKSLREQTNRMAESLEAMKEKSLMLERQIFRLTRELERNSKE